MNIVSLARITSAISDAIASWSNGSAPEAEASTNEENVIPGDASLSGASFAEQEPDLAKEAGVTGRAMSGWSMAGSSLPD